MFPPPIPNGSIATITFLAHPCVIICRHARNLVKQAMNRLVDFFWRHWKFIDVRKVIMTELLLTLSQAGNFFKHLVHRAEIRCNDEINKAILSTFFMQTNKTDSYVEL